MVRFGQPKSRSMERPATKDIDLRGRAADKLVRALAKDLSSNDFSIANGDEVAPEQGYALGRLTIQ